MGKELFRRAVENFFNVENLYEKKLKPISEVEWTVVLKEHPPRYLVVQITALQGDTSRMDTIENLKKLSNGKCVYLL